MLDIDMKYELFASAKQVFVCTSGYNCVLIVGGKWT